MNTSLSVECLFSRQAARVGASEIRELLKLIGSGDIISFAGGVPEPSLFPYDRINLACDRVLGDPEVRAKACQYTTTEGFPPLREWIAAYLSSRGAVLTADNVLITNGAQQAIDLVARLFIDEGDRVAVAKPTYLGALQAFDAYRPDYLAIKTDDQGMLPGELEAAMKMRPKLIYVVPDFQNPDGITYSSDRRQFLVKLADEYGVPILEDSAYDQLRYEGDMLSPLIALGSQAHGSIEEGCYIHAGTFSKTVAPGFRIGWVVAPKPVIQQLVCFKQATDLHSSTINQILMYHVVSEGFTQHLDRCRALYRGRRDAMLEALAENMPPGVTWSRPLGGLFVWLALPEPLNARDLFNQSISKHIAFVPGDAFFTDRSVRNTCRLSFSAISTEQIQEGVRRLATAVKELISR
jgi:DNA-binding transcriptional MocR family regulator